jgi:DNA mismatch repair protein MutS2
MNFTSADTLEFEALRELVARYIQTPLGRAELDRLEPGVDRGELELLLAEASEAIAYLRAAARPGTRGGAIRIDFSDIPDLRQTVQKLRIEGAGLDAPEIFDLVTFLDRAADAKSILAAAAERFPILGARGSRLGDFKALLGDLRGKLLPDGTVADHASPALARLRKDIERQKRHIQDSLERFLKAHREEGVLQEEFVTIRNERFVVPMVSGQRKKLDGVIHGASSSGHTLFLEPLETIELNNDLVRISEEELREVHRILREMTARLRTEAESIRASVETMAALDLTFAKGRFAVEFDCAIPRFSPPAGPPRLLLRDARHPLLEDVLRRQRKRAVPVSLELGGQTRTLLISGPNTGGKTVSLKTVGLLALMAQAGLPVPCAEAEFPLFEQVLADIGDKQSIEASLSTFSAHMSHIREMTLDVTPQSLVLLDEIGSATDPEEGGALGVAIVDHFRAAGAFTLASTHLLALKVYGANTPSVVNGSMGFDDETLEPTYQLRLGAPGKSAGLDIANRLGMPEHIMRRARQAMSGRERDVARFLDELHRRIEETKEQQRQLERRQAELAALEAKVTGREEKLAREMERRLETVIEKFDAQSRKVLDEVAAKTAASPKMLREAQRAVSKTKRELREDFEATVLPDRPASPPPPPIEEGVRVRLRGISWPALVRRKLGDDRIEVEAGVLKMQVPVEDVIEVLPAGAGSSARQKGSGPEAAPTVLEIQVIGHNAEDACDMVDQFLDRAVMASASRVRVIHGHGMGILRKAIAAFLKNHPHVEKYYPAPPQEGGTGATIVELKE